MSCGGSKHANENGQTISDAVRETNALTTATSCIACGGSTGGGHACEPAVLRAFAKKHDQNTAELFARHYLEQDRLGRTIEDLRRVAGQERVGYGRDARWSGTAQEARDTVERMIADAEAAGEHRLASTKHYHSVSDGKSRLGSYDKARDTYKATGVEIQKAEDVYRQFRWNRAFLVVTNGSGHVHSSMECSTCYPTTRYAWLPEYSGDSEDNIVADAGERACTICFPSAPVDVLSRPTRIYSDDERKQLAARDERRRVADEKKAKAIANAPTASGEPLTVTYGDRQWDRETFKTERSAVIWAVDEMSDPYDRGLDGLKQAAVDTIITSVAEKRGVDPDVVRAEITDKAAKKKVKIEKEAAKWRAQNPHLFKD